MTDAVLFVESFQELIDGPGELGQADHGKVPAWDATAQRFVMVVLPQPKGRGGGIILGAAPMTIQQASDGPGSLGSGDNGKALTWNNSTGRFEMATINAADADTLDGHDSTYFLAADGTTVGATTQAQTFTNGIVAPIWKPASNSATALQVQDASGTVFVTGDTTNRRVGIRKTPTVIFDVQSDETPATTMAVHIGNSGGTELITTTTDRDFSGAGNWTGTNWAVSGGVLQHTTGSTANATLTNANLTAGSIISSRRYLVTFTISGMTTGNVTAKIGSASADNGASLANGTYTVTITAAADNSDLIFTPSSTFDGALDNISVVRLQADFSILNNGFVGFGTQSPNRFVEIKGNSSTLFTLLALYNPNQTNDGGGVVSFRTDTNGSGAASFVECGAFRSKVTDHTNATLTSEFHITHRISGAATQALTIDGKGFWGINAVTAPTARLHLAGNATLAAWGLNGSGLRFAGATYTDSSTAGSGTATNAVAYAFGRPTFAASNASVTMTNAATLYIENSPAAGSNATLTNKYALWVDDGDVRLDGNIGFYGAAPAAKPTVTGSRGANAALASLLTALATLGLITDSSS